MFDLLRDQRLHVGWEIRTNVRGKQQRECGDRHGGRTATRIAHEALRDLCEQEAQEPERERPLEPLVPDLLAPHARLGALELPFDLVLEDSLHVRRSRRRTARTPRSRARRRPSRDRRRAG
jgi:hypothetical protein